VKAYVVYESLWGNTRAIAEAVAEGIGPGAQAVPTDGLSAEELAQADLLVAGAPVIAFSLASDQARDNIARSESGAPHPPDVEHPSMRAWLEKLPHAGARAAAFETRIWWSLRGATGDIEKRLRGAGYRVVARPAKFVVEGKYGPLRDGEVERARAWGRTLASDGRPAQSTSVREA
jgi:hypothetical protein